MERNNETEKTMSAAEVAALLSQTMRDLTDRKITLRQAVAASRIALALAKVIEVADLNARVELLEHIFKKKPK